MQPSYDKLLKILIDKKMTKTDLRIKAKISSSTLAKISKNEILSCEVLNKICTALSCKIDDIFELKYDNNIDFSKNTHSNKFKVISLFSGAGGMDLGFINSGFEIIWANDNFNEAVQSYKQNIGNHIINGNISLISSKNIPDNPDVIIGGFPCQGFSIANSKRNIKDERNFLYKEMLRIIADKKPSFFVAENVKGILSLDKGKVFKMIKSDFENLKDNDGNKVGYKVDARVLNAAEFGVPQSRQRVIIIGNKLGVENPFPKPTHYLNKNSLIKNNSKLKPAITTEQAIGFLSDKNITNKDFIISKKEIQEHIKNTKIKNKKDFYKLLGINEKFDFIKISNHIASENVADKFWGRKFNVVQNEICDYLVYWRNKSGWTTKKVNDHFGYKHTAGHWFRKDNNSGSLPSVKDWWELKRIFGFDDKYDEIMTTIIEKNIKFNQSLRITNWDRPSDTITATIPEIHINKNRRLSARECSILQSFPLKYNFQGNLNKIYTQIGNAVPVIMSERIATSIKNTLLKYKDLKK